METTIVQAWNVAPLQRDLAHGARDELHVNPAFRQQRQQRVQLAVADERLAADDRQMKRPVAIDEREDAVDQLLALEVADLRAASAPRRGGRRRRRSSPDTAADTRA